MTGGTSVASSANRPAAVTRYLLLAAILGLIVALFAGRTWLAHSGEPPRLFALFDAITLLGSAGVLLAGWRTLTRRELAVILIVGAVTGLLYPWKTLYQPFGPLFGLPNAALEGLARAMSLVLVGLAGLVIRHWGGPVDLRLAEGSWREAAAAFGWGALIGLPLAGINAFALARMAGRPFDWQDPLAAAVDALQPAVVEELFYRLAFLGLIWLLLRRQWPGQAALLAGLIALFIHSYAHLDEMLVQRPLFALAFGSTVGLIWGLPMTWLALRRNLESATGFHWIQDAVRFLAGL